jgi:deazaflavin-dependent oxidoreductase (nitroreductase family)
MNELELEEMNRGVIADFRANGGKVGGQHASLDIILLHHLGARSGRARVTPLACVRDGEDMLVVASTGGAPRHPAWYWNLKANPRVTVEAGTETVEVIAGEVADEEHGRLWAMITEAIPVMLEYQDRTTRRLPIIRLARRRVQKSDLPGSGSLTHRLS